MAVICLHSSTSRLANPFAGSQGAETVACSWRDGELGAKDDRQGNALSDRDTDPQIFLNNKGRAGPVLVSRFSQQLAACCQANVYRVQDMCKIPAGIQVST